MNPLTHTASFPAQPNPKPADWASRSLLRDRRALYLGLTLTLLLHAAAYWLAPGLTSTWSQVSAITYVVALSPRPAAMPANPRGKRASTRRQAPPAPAFATSSPPAETPIDAGEGLGPGARDLDTEGSFAELFAQSLTSLPVRDVAASHAPPSPSLSAAPPAAPDPPPFELPRAVSITFDARSSITDGVASYTWRREGRNYETQSTLQATGFFVSLFAGVMHQVSKGTVSAAGVSPESFYFRRGDTPPDTAVFHRAGSELRLARAGGPVRVQPLPASIQDTQSFVFHLAYLLAQDRPAGQPIELMVTNARKVYRYRFQVIGFAPQETPWGTVETVHLKSDASDPSDAYEVWLAPSQHNLPVRLKFFAGRFPIELVATSIVSER
ncbi:MAG: DUF3108 domain-containing protein [Betaproteobacteria bacterium]|nr:DUF3108 domain-containing protein [Betaproteobacteria bacterium]